MPGRVVKSVLGHWTFQPDPLPPKLIYDAALVQLLAEAAGALGELRGVGGLLPNPFVLIRPFLRREAVLSSRIEGTVTGLDQLFLFEVEPEESSLPDDAGEVRNYVRATEAGLAAIRAGSPFTLKLLRELHRTLLEGVRGAEKRPGQIRDRAVLIGQSYDFDAARFVPPCHTQLGPLLGDFIDFLRRERTLPIVVQLALRSYQFEAIHPFNDGNGRIGRLLMTLMLCEHRQLPEPLLYLSAYFERNRQEYYDRLLEVSRKAAWNEWIAFFARGVAEQARDAAVRTRQLLKLAAEYRLQAPKLIRSLAALRLIDEILASPYLTIRHAAEVMGLTYATASRTVEIFVNAGWLREVTGQRRNRVFRADRVFTLLDAPRAGGLPPACGRRE